MTLTDGETQQHQTITMPSTDDDVDSIRRGTTRLNQTVEPNRDDPAFQAREKQINEINAKLKTVIEQVRLPSPLSSVSVISFFM